MNRRDLLKSAVAIGVLPLGCSPSTIGLATSVVVRLVIAAGGGWLALRWSADVSYVFAALGAALAAFGLITAGAVATGAWFGPIV